MVRIVHGTNSLSTVRIRELYYFVIITIIITIIIFLLLLLSLLVISHLLTLFDCCHLTNKGVY